MEQFGLSEMLLLGMLAIATIVVHARLRAAGQLMWAILASLAGMGLMVYLALYGI